MKTREKTRLQLELQKSFLFYFDHCNCLTGSIRNLLERSNFDKSHFIKLIKEVSKFFKGESELLAKVKDSKSLPELLNNLPSKNIMKNIIKERDLKLKKEDPSINTKNSIYAISVPMGGQIKK